MILYIRTGDGPIELPIFYRDYGFGDLARSKRRAQTAALADQINSIAAGLQYTPPTVAPSMPRSSPHQSINPYAAPAISNDSCLSC